MPALSEPDAPAAAADLPRRIFSPIARGYDRAALVLSLFQYRRWHRFLLSQILKSVHPEESKDRRSSSAEAEESKPERDPRVTPRILDMATGTGALAFDLLAVTDARVVAADITGPMLRHAQGRTDGHPNGRLRFVECAAEAPPFANESFDAITFAYLLRYVSDVPATLDALGRLLRPGGVMASLEFAVPRGVWYPPWRLYVDAVLPAGGRLFSREWRDVGAFLGPSIRGFYRRWPEARLLRAWQEAGFVDLRSRRLSLGGAIVVWGRKAG
jgi:demethylmenaquinone methyltransferase/2-methoxy-6-polyprenyl-1,4-benzoquinol methylase